jgi:hypothetical protein
MGLSINPTIGAPGAIIYATGTGSKKTRTRIRIDSDLVDEFTMPASGKFTSRPITIPGKPNGTYRVSLQQKQQIGDVWPEIAFTNLTIELAASPDTNTNIALSKSSTSSSVESTLMVAGNAVDGNLSTRWASLSGSDPQWIYVDLGSTYIVDRVVITWEAAYATSYQVQVANDTTNWSTIFSTTIGNGGIDDIPVSGTGRYVRIYGTARGTPWGYSIWELAVYGTATTTPTVGLPVAPSNLTATAGDTTATLTWGV